MKYVLTMLVLVGVLQAEDYYKNGTTIIATGKMHELINGLMGTDPKVHGNLSYKALVVKQQASQTVAVKQSQQQVQVVNRTYGSMKKPYKTITVDIYQETDVRVEQRQAQIAKLIAQLKQLQESKVTVEPKFKVIVR